MNGSKTFESAAEELEGIVRQLESDAISLEESLLLFERGIELSRFCSGKLDEAEKKILVLADNPNEGGEPETLRVPEDGTNHTLDQD